MLAFETRAPLAANPVASPRGADRPTSCSLWASKLYGWASRDHHWWAWQTHAVNPGLCGTFACEEVQALVIRHVPPLSQRRALFSAGRSGTHVCGGLAGISDPGEQAQVLLRQKLPCTKRAARPGQPLEPHPFPSGACKVRALPHCVKMLPGSGVHLCLLISGSA